MTTIRARVLRDFQDFKAGDFADFEKAEAKQLEDGGAIDTRASEKAGEASPVKTKAK